METPPPHLHGRMRPSLVTARDAVCPGVGGWRLRAGLQGAFFGTGFCSGGWCAGAQGGERGKKAEEGEEGARKRRRRKRRVCGSAKPATAWVKLGLEYPWSTVTQPPGPTGRGDVSVRSKSFDLGERMLLPLFPLRKCSLHSPVFLQLHILPHPLVRALGPSHKIPIFANY